MKAATQSLTTQNLLFEEEDVKKPEDEKEARMRRAPILNQIELLNEETFRKVKPVIQFIFDII